jgi:hypothetical protein
MSIFETPLDAYETEMLSLRANVLRRTDGWDGDTLTKLISVIARRHADDPVAAVTDELMEGGAYHPSERPKVYDALSTLTRQFAPDMRAFNAVKLDAAVHIRPGSRAAWRAYMNKLIDLFEYGEKGKTGQVEEASQWRRNPNEANP